MMNVYESWANELTVDEALRMLDDCACDPSDDAYHVDYFVENGKVFGITNV